MHLFPTGSTFTSTTTGITYEIKEGVDCDSKSVVYLITCQFCNAQYVGSTSQKFRYRSTQHRFDIRNERKSGHCGYVSHFQNEDCTYAVQVIKQCDESNRMEWEQKMFDLIRPSMNLVRPMRPLKKED